jgi:hypothetical protein
LYKELNEEIIFVEKTWFLLYIFFGDDFFRIDYRIIEIQPATKYLIHFTVAKKNHHTQASQATAYSE